MYTWTALALAFCVVYPAQTVILHQETGAIHIHRKGHTLNQDEDSPLQPEDREATKNAEAFIKNLLPKLDTTIKKSVTYNLLYEINSLISLYLYNFKIKGFRAATLDNIVVRKKKLTMDFSASIPFLSTDGTVFLNGIIDNTTFATVGNLSTFSDDVKIKGKLIFIPLQLPSTNVPVLQIADADITIDINNVMIDFKIIEELMVFKMTLVQFMNKPVEDIIYSVSTAAGRLINTELAKVSAETIMNFLTPPKPRLRSHYWNPNYRNDYYY